MSNIPRLKDMPFIEWQDDFGATQRVYPDVQESEDMSFPAEVTTNPVEEGADVADDYQIQPDTIDLKWFISEVPIRGDLGSVRGTLQTITLKYPPGPGPAISLNTLVTAVSALLGFGDAPPKRVTVLKFPTAPKRTAEVLSALRDIRANKRLCRVRTSSVDLSDMMLVNANQTRSKAEGDGSRISLSFQRVEFVQSQEALAVPVEARAVPKKQIGTQGTEGEGVDGTKNVSLLARLRDAVGGK